MSEESSRRRGMGPRPFVSAEWPALRRYRRGGAPVVFDPCRKILVPAHPEEEVRQRFVAYLVGELGVPPTMLYTECPMSDWKGGGRGRVDLVCWERTGDRDQSYLLVECKAPSVPLTDDAVEQAFRYDEVVKANFVAITNGTTTFWFQRCKDNERPATYDPLSTPPTFPQMATNQAMARRPPHRAPPRPHFGATGVAAKRQFADVGAIGEGSPASHYPYLFNLAGLFHFDPDDPPLNWKRLHLSETGRRGTWFGNAAGGTWSGQYRYFHVQDEQGESQIVSISVLRKMLVRDDPRFGSTNGHTMLIVAVDDFEKRHASLQLDLDRYVRQRTETVEVWHDGTLTRGKRGAAKRSEVLAYVREHAPDLVRSDEVVLGGFPATRLAMWSDVVDLTERLARYALLRDAFRRACG